ncbi:hypothetical protein R3P38DRAFT_3171115 [Favolaschia claudopus]|uniref:Transmembrane protein n=1 Tax=Favolaschia claudopus TaxID=2862362 RepID=A0AAW0DMC5_9AGAR
MSFSIPANDGINLEFSICSAVFIIGDHQRRRTPRSPLWVSTPVMVTLRSWLLFFGLNVCVSAVGLRDAMPSSPAVRLDVLLPHTRNMESAPSNVLGRRDLSPHQIAVLTISIGTVGGIAMVATLVLGLLLIWRRRRDRQKVRELAIDLPSPNGPPEPIPVHSKEQSYAYENVPTLSPSLPPEPRRFEDAESAWFIDERDQLGQLPLANSRFRIPKNASSPRMKPEPVSNIPSQNLQLGQPSSEAATAPSNAAQSSMRPSGGYEGRQEIVREKRLPEVPVEYSTTWSPQGHPYVVKERNVDILTAPNFSLPSTSTPGSHLASTPERHAVVSPPRIPQELSRSHSPAVLRQPEPPEVVTIVPRPRGSSLQQGSRREAAVTMPASGRHVISVSEDISRPSSRFSISPVAQSFGSRLAFSGSPSSSTRPPRHNRFGSLSGFVHFRSHSSSPDVPVDVVASSPPR